MSPIIEIVDVGYGDKTDRPASHLVGRIPDAVGTYNITSSGVVGVIQIEAMWVDPASLAQEIILGGETNVVGAGRDGSLLSSRRRVQINARTGVGESLLNERWALRVTLVEPIRKEGEWRRDGRRGARTGWRRIEG